MTEKKRPRKDARLGVESVQTHLLSMLRPGRKLVVVDGCFVLYGIDDTTRVCCGTTLAELAETYLAIRARDVVCGNSTP